MSARNGAILIGIAGGSGSGKTHLARRVREIIGESNVSVLSMDQYFISDPEENGLEINFDHPAHLDFDLMLRHLRQLRKGKSIVAPGYDFRLMRRRPNQVSVPARPVILVEGLFVLADPIVKLIDLTCFLDVEVDQRLLGRILRDLEERESTIEKIVDRYQRFVRPSYHVFVAPTMQNADIVVDFTYRRALFTELLASWVRGYCDGAIDAAEFIGKIRAESYQIGYKPQQAFMPGAVDIRQLAKAYPASAYPEAVPPVPGKHPKLFIGANP